MMPLHGVAVAVSLWLAAFPAAAAITSHRESFTSSGRSIRVDVYEPVRPGAHRSIIVLHGAGGMLFDGPEMRRMANALASGNDRVYVVHYFDRTGMGFTFRNAVLLAHFDEWLATVRDTVKWVGDRETREGRAVPLGIYGYSMGAFLGLVASPLEPGVGALAEQAGGVWKNQFERIGRLPPVLMIHGWKDRRVPFEQYAIPLQAELRRRATRFATAFYEEEGHVFGQPAMGQVRVQVADFFDRQLPLPAGKPSSFQRKPGQRTGTGPNPSVNPKPNHQPL